METKKQSVIIGAALFLAAAVPGFGATVGVLGSADDFAVLGASTVTNTGTTLLVADYPVDAALYRDKAAAHGRGLRCNLDPRLLESGPVDRILERVDALLDRAGSYRRFVLGTGVVSFDTPEANILAVRGHLERMESEGKVHE